MTLTALSDTVRLVAVVRDQVGRSMPGFAVAWSSGDTSVALVDASGLLMATGNGNTRVTATAGSVSGTSSVTVIQRANDVTVSPDVTMLQVGDTLRLTAEATDAKGHPVAGAQFEWTSSDPSVVRVDGSGLVRAATEGTATVTATSGDAEGASDITVANTDRAALTALYNATGGPTWVNNDNWLSEAPLGEWYGVRTDSYGRVISLGLTRNNLMGGIPSELGSLGKLELLSLEENALSGPIPSELGNLANLTALFLDYNQLSGPIPPEFGRLLNLTNLGLNGNELTGPIPRELGNLRNLTQLRLFNNDLTGPIPRAFEVVLRRWTVRGQS